MPENDVTPELDAAILRYLDSQPEAVDSLRGVVTDWLKEVVSDAGHVERALERLVERKLVERIRLADGTIVYGKPNAGTPECTSR